MSLVDHEAGRYESVAKPEATLAADRRALVAVGSANLAPTLATQGFNTRQRIGALVEVLVTGGTSVIGVLWGYNATSGKWTSIIMTGSSSDTALSAGDHKSYVVAIAGFDRLYLELKTFSSTPVVDAWISVGG